MCSRFILYSTSAWRLIFLPPTLKTRELHDGARVLRETLTSQWDLATTNISTNGPEESQKLRNLEELFYTSVDNTSVTSVQSKANL